MNQQLILVYFIVMFLLYFADKDFKDILKEKYYSKNINNLDIHINSMQTIYRYLKENSLYGIFYVFRYQILFISCILIFDIQYYILYNNISTFILVTSILSILAFFFNMYLPLTKMYLPTIKSSIKYSINIADCFYRSNLEISNDIIIDYTKIANKEKIINDIKMLTIFDYDKYTKLLKIENLEKISKEEFSEYFFIIKNDYYIFMYKNMLSSINLNEKNDNLEINNVTIYPNDMYMRLIKDTKIQYKIYERYLDIISLFLVMYFL